MTHKFNWKMAIILVVGIIAVVTLVIFGVQGVQNKAYSLEEQVNVAISNVKVQEKRRVDLVYNLADCVKQYDKHESETLIAVAEGRSSNGTVENIGCVIISLIGQKFSQRRKY